MTAVEREKRTSDAVVVHHHRAAGCTDDQHTWQLRSVEFEDGATARCFECLCCAACLVD